MWWIYILLIAVCLLKIRFICRIFSGINFENNIDAVVSFFLFAYLGLNCITFILRNINDLIERIEIKYFSFLLILLLHISMVYIVAFVFSMIMVVFTISIKSYFPNKKNIDSLSIGLKIIFIVCKAKSIIKLRELFNRYINPFYGLDITLYKVIKGSLFLAYLVSGIFIMTFMYDILIIEVGLQGDILEITKNSFELYKDIFIVSLIPYGVIFINAQKDNSKVH